MTKRLVFFALLLAPLAGVGVAAWASFVRDDSYSSGLARALDPVPEAAEAAPAAEAGQATGTVPAPVPEPDPEPRARRGVPDVRLAGIDAFHLALRKPPRAGLVFDLETGAVLWRRAPLRVLPMASLTKIMTALLVVERARPREPVRITAAALRYSGSGVGVLPKGKRVRLETLLNGLLIVSGNDAAIALAVHVAGSERRFVGLMNARARRWGLSCTRFASSHGLEDGNRSCAHDLAVLARLAMRKPRIRRIAAREQADFRFPIKGKRLYLSGHNPLLRLDYPGTLGLKTGYTDAAGRCFIGVARRDGRTLGVVLLNSPDPSKQAPKLLDAGFATGG